MQTTTGKIYVVGMGPGDATYMTGQALSALAHAEEIIGYTTYIRLLQAQFPQYHYTATPMKQEIARCEYAISAAMQGKIVAIVSSGDSGIYGMAGLVLELSQKMQAEIAIEIVPGITAAVAAAAALGSPLMHDFAIISLSDLMTPLSLIYRRVALAAEGDFVICLYNPKSHTRTTYLAEATQRILAFRSEKTPVGIVRNAGRAEESIRITTLGQLPEAEVDMFCVVIIGNSQTYCSGGRMITPRGYRLENPESDK